MLDEERGSREELLWPDCRDREELYGIGGRGLPMKSLAVRGWLSACATGEVHPVSIKLKQPQAMIAGHTRLLLRRHIRLLCRSVFILSSFCVLHFSFFIFILPSARGPAEAAR